MIRTITYFILGIVASSTHVAGAMNTPSENIRKLVEDLQEHANVSIKGQQLYCTQIIPEFYTRSQFELAWQNRQNINVFINALSKADEQGLEKDDYHYQLINSLAEKTRNSAEKSELDILLTDAFFLYSIHLLNGKINPETLDSEWQAVRRETRSIQLYERAITGKYIDEFLVGQEPQVGSYQELKKALREYKSLSQKGGWPDIPNGITLKPGMQDSIRVPLLIRRLTITGELHKEYENLNNQYTSTISDAVKKYQAKNGLEEDGNLGKMTTASMNVPVQKRIDQIIVNLERHRWIAHDLGDRYVFVNIAAFQMKVIENDELVFQEKVIVGKPYRKTPVFSSQMTYFVLNPYWTLPPVILYNDILPEMKKNPAYLGSKNILVFQGYGTDAKEIDPSTLDWSEFSKGNFPYKLRQDPGKLNALGQVKFMFSNKYNVYIHDTPGKELFHRPERTFSSGCIRLNNPMSFLQYLLKDQADLSMEKVDKILAQGKEHTILLKNPLNIHIQYLTCWAENEIVHFRNDIYDRDKAILMALKEQPSIL